MDTLKKEEEIIAWLDKYKVKNYTLSEDAEYGYVVDVDGQVDLQSRELSIIPVKFNKVTGTFNCSLNELKILKGCPASVGKDFYCDNNQLTSLEGAPSFVGEEFWCNDNKLTSLRDCPASVGGNFDCCNNQIKNLDYNPNSVGEHFFCNGNPLLGKYQHIIYFEELKEKITSAKERHLLSNSLVKPMHSILRKL